VKDRSDSTFRDLETTIPLRLSKSLKRLRKNSLMGKTGSSLVPNPRKVQPQRLRLHPHFAGEKWTVACIPVTQAEDHSKDHKGSHNFLACAIFTSAQSLAMHIDEDVRVQFAAMRQISSRNIMNFSIENPVGALPKLVTKIARGDREIPTSHLHIDFN